MSQRSLVVSIIAIIVFAVTTLYAADHVAGRINGSAPVCNCPSSAPAETDRFDHAMAFAIYSELDEANTRDLVVASRQHPELAPELRYHAFSQAIHLHRSFNNVAPGLLRTTPLADDPFFATDFAALRDRYQREHPNDHDPIE
jgi:hypothetical protein